MKAVVTFNCRLEIDVDEKLRDNIVPENDQIKQLKCLLMEECDCEHVDISEYRMTISGA